MSDPIHNTGAGAAGVLYGTPSPDTGRREDDPQAAATPDAASVLYGARPPAPNAAEPKAAENGQESESAADRLYYSPESLASSYGPQLADALGDLTDLAPELAEKRVEILAETSQLYSDAAIGPEQAATLHAAFVSALKNPPSDEQATAWAQESRAWLQETLGQDWEQDGRLQRVRAFVDARPALKQLLEATGLGDSPVFVKAFLERAGQMRVAPRKSKH